MHSHTNTDYALSDSRMHARALSQRVDAGNLVLPEGRGELVEGGQDTTLRWRPKYRYAHGYPGQVW